MKLFFRGIRRGSFLAAAFACVFLIAGGAFYSRASQLTNESIRQKESQIADAKKERDELKQGLTDLQKIKNELQKSKNDLDAYVTQLDRNLTEIQDRIDALEEKIAEKEEQIEETEEELEEALAVQEAQYEAMKERIRFMYENGDALYLEMLLESDTFASMLNKAEYIQDLSGYDRRKLDEYIATTRMVELTKESLEEEKKTLDEAREAAAQERVNMQELINEKNAEIKALSADIAAQESSIQEYETYIAEQNNTIAALEAVVAQERAALAEENRRKYDGGMFTWPAPSYTRISDDYGNRIHPILGVVKFHNGIDLAAPGGSPILAAYDGKVVAASYSSSMGNYVMIDHGDGLYTIYMHASKLYVSTGQEVAKGQTIAAVGSTGRSTGNHLHFSVRLNGQYVSPWGYLK